MLRTQNLVPSVYYDNSRDFQFLGRTFDVVFNYLKMNIDLVKESPLSANLDDKLIPLLAKTLGFEVKHNYNTQDLKSICSVFVELIRNKGTHLAIENACKTLMNSQNISGYLGVDTTTYVPDDDPSGKSSYTVYIYLPAEVTDTVLLEDLFDYILPAGYDYRFIRSVKPEKQPTTSIGVDYKLNKFNLKSFNIGQVAKPNENTTRPDNVEFSDDEVDITSKFATIFTGKIIGGDEQQ